MFTEWKNDSTANPIAVIKQHTTFKRDPQTFFIPPLYLKPLIFYLALTYVLTIALRQ
jgi:hypothetical protein